MVGRHDPSTVGYGDVIPVTPEGRLVAGALMLLGIGLFGAITAIVTNTLLTESEAASTRPIDDLERLDALQRSGALTAVEFEAAKDRVLARI